MLAGLGLALAAYVVPFLLIGAFAQAFGGELSFEDVGDAFAKGEEILHYADEKAQAIEAGGDLPDVPLIFGDPITARTAWVFAAINAMLIVAAVLIVAGLRPRETFQRLGLNRYQLDRLWLPAALAAAAYLVIVGYGAAMERLDIEILEPQSRPLRTTARDDWALGLFAFTAAVGAPIAEEFLFRGLVFGGLLKRFGFWVAALVSGFAFSLAHFDPGTLLPFMAMGALMAWLFRRTGSLWDSIALHACFNSVSLAILIATRP